MDWSAIANQEHPNGSPNLIKIWKQKSLKAANFEYYDNWPLSIVYYTILMLRTWVFLFMIVLLYHDIFISNSGYCSDSSVKIMLLRRSCCVLCHRHMKFGVKLYSIYVICRFTYLSHQCGTLKAFTTTMALIQSMFFAFHLKNSSKLHFRQTQP